MAMAKDIALHEVGPHRLVGSGDIVEGVGLTQIRKTKLVKLVLLPVCDLWAAGVTRVMMCAVWTPRC